MTIEEKRRNIKAELKADPSTALAIARCMNRENGNYEDLNAEWIEDIAEWMKAYDLARAIIYGNVNSITEMVRFDAYGNLETVYESDLEDKAIAYYLDDITDDIINHTSTLYKNLPDEIKEIVDEEIDF